LLLTNVDISRAGVYSATVTNSAGAVSSVYAVLAVNRPPLPGAYSTVTGQGIPISTGTSNLLALAFDPDGDAFNLASVNSPTANGASVVLTNSLIWFAPPMSFVGTDQWQYVLTDVRGASATGIVNVQVISSNNITLNAISQGMLNDGSFSADFQGVAGLQYTVDRATNIEGPWEVNYTNLTADSNGFFQLNDPNLPPVELRFYRTRYP